MFTRMFRTIGFFYLCLFTFVTFSVAHAGAWEIYSYNDFEPSEGDRFLVDINNALGYLINYENKSYTVFPIMTGAGRTPTPEKEWVILEENIQPNRIIFAESGEFFRMYANGETRTGYGVHGYAYFAEEMVKGTKFLSLGCVLVADNVLDLIEESFIANGNTLQMRTTAEVNVSSYLRFGM